MSREGWGESDSRRRCPIADRCYAYCDQGDWVACPVVKAAKKGGHWGQSRANHGTIERYIDGCRCDTCLRIGGELKGRRSKFDK